jgi:DNA primase
LILSHQINFRNTIATSGTAFSGEIFDKEKNISNLGLVRRLSNNIVIAFDGDKAGLAATKRASKIALDLGMDVKVTKIEGGLDPADFIGQKGKDGWREIIKNSKHIIEAILDSILDEFRDDSRKVGKLVKEELLPYLALLNSEIDRNHFLDLISKKTMIPIEALRSDFKNLLLSSESVLAYNKEVNPFLNKDDSDYISREKRITNWLLGIIFWQKELKNTILDLDKIIKHVEKILKKDLVNLAKDREINKEELVFKVEEFYSSKDIDFINQDAKELVKELYILDLENKALEMQNDLNNIEILQAYNLIKIEIENIKNGHFNFE